MVIISVLVIYAAAVGGIVDHVLARCRWVTSTPQAALRLWHASAMTYLSALAAALLLVAHDGWEHLVVWLFQADRYRVHAVYGGPWQVSELTYATFLAMLVAGTGVTVVAARRVRATLGERSRQRLAVTALAHSGEGALRNVCVLAHPTPAAFCIPGRGRSAQIVVTSSTMTALSDDELAATVEHERAHLHHRHHRGILIADVLTAAVGWCGALRNYADQVRRLSEMAADDHACRTAEPVTVASALLRLCPVEPQPSQEEGGQAVRRGVEPDPAERIHRLMASRSRPPQRVVSGVAAVAAAALLVLPPTVMFAPASALAGSADCSGQCHGST